ncbi:MAG: hypothetical protein P4L92_07430, partial [Rudaea sp.]|nr:hypothetical protein [Rudaea sp.]
MRVTIEHFDAKHRNEVRHNVKCAINFSLEESAIIRERSLGSGRLVFEHGVVNHPAEADGSISPTMLYLGMRLLLIASV